MTKKVVLAVALMVGMAGYTWAQSVGPTAVVPEIDPALGVSAFALLSTALMMARGRRKK